MGNSRRPAARTPEQARRLIVLATANRDLGDALDWSDAHYGVAVAGRLLERFESACRLLTRQPAIGTAARDGAREFPLQSYPYTLVYRVDSTTIQVIALRHQRRKPRV